ncbi:MAG: dTDP-4-dehydrorhamnose 3,5-epimerase [Flavobacteriales bacterium]|jgi:dTDP-4-dehydrorhamnose 3,5-epimerase|nr:dTDP-4-dehydrorhamnose 3,5-epimerase [Flavobacteriales bacterium]
MTITPTPLQGLLKLCPRQFTDDRGRFIVTFDQKLFDQAVGGTTHFVQDNESTSRKGVLRGLHFQLPPSAQGKLVHVVRGSVLDVCVDIRPSSPTFGQHFKQLLDDQQKEMLWIPPGFAHGFVSLEDHTVFAYKCTALYDPAQERCIRWNDHDLGIDWGVKDPLVSPKDAAGGGFNERNWWPAT